ncbi:MAG TPA: hypothetical protein VI583_14535, partial [Cyclobacteriaceae bacterium]|nr:hypothetical protein [Cyclobacteriaceae bacterium]
MKRTLLLFMAVTLITGCKKSDLPYTGLSADKIYAESDIILTDSIIFHPVRVDQDSNILPWFSSNLGQAYDDAITRVWGFWKNMEIDSNGIPYYMYHQVWKPNHDPRGLGGDQLQMALSSWNLLYDYTGNEAVLENMKFMADYYLSHSLSSPDDDWPNLPYPYNMDIHSGFYDGDMIIGKNYTQPDKAGSFGFELLILYKKTGDINYLAAAVNIANTLAEKVQRGDNDRSPWPFKVNAKTGETGVLLDEGGGWYEGMPDDIKTKNLKKIESSYTTNWTGTLELFEGLIQLKEGDTELFKKAFDIALDWLKTYPAKTNKWGPFFEDVPRWSDTQINAITYAMYLLEHPDADPNWKESVKNIFNWVHGELDDNRYSKYGVMVTDEQTAYRQPGNSHSSRQASMELRYWEKTGDTTHTRNAVRMLNWATYMVDFNGKNFYPTNAIWMTDGYGDYVRHYLRAMAAAPQLAPDHADHLLRTSSVVTNISYSPERITYSTFDTVSTELLRLTSKPKSIKMRNTVMKKSSDESPEGYTWKVLDKGGILT